MSLDNVEKFKMKYGRPPIICLCGSTRFSKAFREANLRQTMKGKIVLTIGCDMRSDDEIFTAMTPEQKAETKRMLDELHFRKIDLADEVLILNVGGYIGQSTSNELSYAEKHGKRVWYLEEPSLIADDKEHSDSENQFGWHTGDVE